MPLFALLVIDRWEADFIGSFFLARCLGSGPTTLLTTRIRKGFLASHFGRFLGRMVFAYCFSGVLRIWPKALELPHIGMGALRYPFQVEVHPLRGSVGIHTSFPRAGGPFLLSFF